MRLLSNLHVKGKPAVLPDRAIRRQSHYFIYRPRRLRPFLQWFVRYLYTTTWQISVTDIVTDKAGNWIPYLCISSAGCVCVWGGGGEMTSGEIQKR